MADDVVYSNKNGNWKTKKVTVLGPDGKALKAGTDYDKSIHYTSDPEGETEIDPTAKLDAGTTVYVWADAKGTNYSGTAMGSYRIVARDIGKLTATPDIKLYTGKAVKLSKGDIRWKSGTKGILWWWRNLFN
ncbi:MAG: hypothetical protein K6D90_08405 [Lachnospiraceae bacterium]|nr:hypothetical protein [Lachnospiraceae bacterium]